MTFMASMILVARAVVGSGAFAQGSAAQETAAVARVQGTATIWLALVDVGDYAQGREQGGEQGGEQGWDQIAAPFQAGISTMKWTTTVGVVRSSYGTLK